MHVLLDHLTATVVGSIVLLVLLAVVMRTGEAETDQQVYETSQRMAQSLAQQLEGDLLNIGYGLPSTVAPIESWTDSSLVIHRRSGTQPTDPILRVEYRRTTRDSTVVDGVTLPVYQVERFQDGAPAGGTAPTLTAFELDLIDAAGAETTDLAQAVAVRALFRTSFGTGDDQADNGSRFSRTFHSANLAP